MNEAVPTAERSASGTPQLAIERAVIGERHRIARNLHDEFGQLLATMTLIIDELSAPEGETRELAIERLAGLALHATRTVRTLTSELRQDEPTVFDVVERLRAMAESFDVTHGIPCRFLGPSRRRDDRRTTAAIIHVAQEVLVNVARHSGAESVIITVSVDDDSFHVLITDDGVGVSADASTTTTRRRPGSGLGIIRERLDAVGGSLSIASDAAGTAVEFSVPFAETPERWTTA